MSAQIKFSPMHIVLDYVKSRTLSVTRQEIIKGTGLATDQVRKATNQLVAKGSLATELDNVGVTYYMTPEANMKKIQKIETLANEKPKTIIASGWKEAKPSEPKGWNSLVEEAEQRGFALGYAKGAQEAQRAAYDMGRKSVLRKLESLLS